MKDLEKVIPYQLARVDRPRPPGSHRGAGLPLPRGPRKSLPAAGCVPDRGRALRQFHPRTPPQTLAAPSPALKPWRSLKPKTNAGMCTTPSLKRRCWNVFMPSATAAPAAAAPCRRTSTAPPCWRPPATPPGWMKTSASAAGNAMSICQFGALSVDGGREPR